MSSINYHNPWGSTHQGGGKKNWGKQNIKDYHSKLPTQIIIQPSNYTSIKNIFLDYYFPGYLPTIKSSRKVWQLH